MLDVCVSVVSRIFFSDRKVISVKLVFLDVSDGHKTVQLQLTSERGDVIVDTLTFSPALDATVHSGSIPRWRRPCASAEKVSLQRNSEKFPFCSTFSVSSDCERSQRVHKTRSTTESSIAITDLGVALAERPCEDGPPSEPLPLAKSGQGENNRRFPCKHIPVDLGLDGFHFLQKLWTLPYSLLTGVICATASVIVRRRRSSPARGVQLTAAPRSGSVSGRKAPLTSCLSLMKLSCVVLH